MNRRRSSSFKRHPSIWISRRQAVWTAVTVLCLCGSVIRSNSVHSEESSATTSATTTKPGQPDHDPSNALRKGAADNARTATQGDPPAAEQATAPARSETLTADDSAPESQSATEQKWRATNKTDPRWQKSVPGDAKWKPTDRAAHPQHLAAASQQPGRAKIFDQQPGRAKLFDQQPGRATIGDGGLPLQASAGGQSGRATISDTPAHPVANAAPGRASLSDAPGLPRSNSREQSALPTIAAESHQRRTPLPVISHSEARDPGKDKLKPHPLRENHAVVIIPQPGDPSKEPHKSVGEPTNAWSPTGVKDRAAAPAKHNAFVWDSPGQAAEPTVTETDSTDSSFDWMDPQPATPNTASLASGKDPGTESAGHSDAAASGSHSDSSPEAEWVTSTEPAPQHAAPDADADAASTSSIEIVAGESPAAADADSKVVGAVGEIVVPEGATASDIVPVTAVSVHPMETADAAQIPNGDLHELPGGDSEDDSLPPEPWQLTHIDVSMRLPNKSPHKPHFLMARIEGPTLPLPEPAAEEQVPPSTILPAPAAFEPVPATTGFPESPAAEPMPPSLSFPASPAAEPVPTITSFPASPTVSPRHPGSDALDAIVISIPTVPDGSERRENRFDSSDITGPRRIAAMDEEPSPTLAPPQIKSPRRIATGVRDASLGIQSPQRTGFVMRNASAEIRSPRKVALFQDDEHPEAEFIGPQPGMPTLDPDAAGDALTQQPPAQLGEDQKLGEAPEDNTLRFLRQQTVLLEPGEHQFDVSIQYLNDKFDFVLVRDQGGGVQVAEAQQRQRLLFVPLQLRVGITKYTQAFVSVPFGWANSETGFLGEDQAKNTGGIGDVNAGFVKQLVVGNEFYPDVLATCGFSAPTGESAFETALGTPGSNLGEGFWSVSAALTFIQNYDPLVIFYGAGYRYRFEEKFDRAFKVNPGNQAFYRMGVGFAVNPNVTLSAEFFGSFINEFQVNGEDIGGSSQEPAQIRLAATINKRRPSKTHSSVKLVEPFVTFGLNDDSIDTILGITWTY